MAAALRGGSARKRNFAGSAMDRADELRDQPNEERGSSYAAQNFCFWRRMVHGPNVN